MQQQPASPKNPSHGPLSGLRVIEFAGIGPGPFAGMMLADMGADVIVIDRASEVRAGNRTMAVQRGKRSIALDMKSEAGQDIVWRLLESADALIEGFRPGVMERLGFGPKPYWPAARSWSTAASPAGARPDRWRSPPATTSTTWH